MSDAARPSAVALSSPTIALSARFAGELPELAVPWRAERVADPALLVLNEPLAHQVLIS